VLVLVLAVAGRAEPQDAPPPEVVAPPADQCPPSTSIWTDGLHDALADRTAYLCGCAAPAGSWISVSMAIQRDGSVARPSVLASTAMDQRASGCILTRVHRVARTWLAAARPALAQVHADRATGPTFDFPVIECASASREDAVGRLSEAFTSSHPHGLRQGTSLPRSPCRPTLRSVVNLQLRF
jgi:hypothetical protein